MKKSAVFLASLIAASISGAAFAGEVESNKGQDIATAAVGVSAVDIDASDYIGQPIYSSDSKRLGAVYGATSSGSAQLIVGTKMVVIASSTLSVEDGKLTTSLTRKEVMKLR